MFKKLLCLSALLTTPLNAWANHGPGTSGGGADTLSGETLRAGTFSFSLDSRYTDYDSISREEAEERAGESGEFDALRDSFVTSLSASYGITDDLQVDASLGWYSGRDFIDAHLHDEDHEAEPDDEGLHSAHGEIEHDEASSVSSAIGDPEGLTDLLVQFRYRVLEGSAGHLALIGGAIAPIGKDDARLDNGEKLEPSSQPGSGRWSFQGGLAYSRYLTPTLTLDASALYTIRTERASFTMGDRFDGGAALNYRITDSVKSFPQWSVFGETTVVWIGKDESSEGKNENSGGTTLFLTPGMRVRFSETLSLALAPSFPVIQDLNGEQLDTKFRMGTNLTMTF